LAIEASAGFSFFAKTSDLGVKASSALTRED
jgi:hypothetical protein